MLDANPALRTFLSLGTAFALGTAIGFERQLRQRNAGLRTTVLVAIGAAAFTDLGFRLLGVEGATRLVAYVVSGIGFLGAGVILKDGTQIRGLNTAATLWCAAAVGAFAGAGLPLEAGLLSLFILAGNTLLRPVVDYLNRRPITQGMTEAKYQVHAFCAQRDLNDVRDALAETLEGMHYPIREFHLTSERENMMEITAILVPTSANPQELDTAVATLEKSPKIVSATWSVETVS